MTHFKEFKLKKIYINKLYHIRTEILKTRTYLGIKSSNKDDYATIIVSSGMYKKYKEALKNEII